jgi:NAD-dependent deacetylase
MILAFTGAGISAESGIPTFAEQPGIRDILTRSYANEHPNEYNETIRKMQETCEAAQPNDAHYALAEYDVPIITMNVDGLHQRAGSKHVLAVHGEFPDVVLYDDPAPRYNTARDWVWHMDKGDTLLVVGTSFYTQISVELKTMALRAGADVYLIEKNAATEVRKYLSRVKTTPCTFEEFLHRFG